MTKQEIRPLPKGFRTREVSGESDLQKLTLAYATEYWAGAWKELLISPDGTQYGSRDSEGKIYPETQEILDRYGTDPEVDSNWVKTLWKKASQGKINDSQGEELSPFWTLESAREALDKFIRPIGEGGFGGRIVALYNKTFREIVGFTAFTIVDLEQTEDVINIRFKSPNILLSADKQSTIKMTAGKLLTTVLPSNKFGIFLDFAIAEEFRGGGLGSVLFDERLRIMKEGRAEVIFGRTTDASPAQARGNYSKRGMKIIARDPKDPQKVYMCAKTDSLVKRENERV